MVQRFGLAIVGLIGVAVVSAGSLQAVGESQAPASQSSSSGRALLDQYCVSCHNQRANVAGLALDASDIANVGPHAEVWEKVVRKLRAGLMPPAGRPRPDRAVIDGFAGWLETELDGWAATHPHPGRTETFHRLNRAEYRNVVRDLLALDIDVNDLLPADDGSYGFDNMAGALKINPTLMEQYLSAARKISRAAVGSPPPTPTVETFNPSAEESQYQRVDGLPLGTRGGIRIRYHFPVDAEYVIRVGLKKADNTPQPDQFEISIDGERVKLFALTDGNEAPVLSSGAPLPLGIYGEGNEVRVPVKAGPHDVVATFPQLSATYIDKGARQHFQKPRVYDLGGTMLPTAVFVDNLSISGPFNITGPGDTPSRRRVFICQPASPAEDDSCARRILSVVARRAYRRPVIDADMRDLLGFYRQGRADGSFQAGIEMALRRILTSPEFLYRVESDPAKVAPDTNYRLNDLEVASRLSFFLWSSIPDDELLDVAIRGRLTDPAVLEHHVRRMLADHRAQALVNNFVGQWLRLRNVPNQRPSDRLFPDFDEGLRVGFQRETELFFASIMREDRSLLDLLTADYTYLNERLARHYGIPNVKGSHFRRVTLTDERRRGLLGQGSILLVTSRDNRTSPVLRGKWILDNILGTPPPPPPPNVPALEEKNLRAMPGTTPSVRERMAAHRANPACATCHAMIDPLGFGLENFDATGKWRDVDEDFNRIDASGVLPSGTKFDGVNVLRNALLANTDRFVATVIEKLLTYALGRGLESYDMPAVRAIAREAAPGRYRLSALILGVVRSQPFQIRRSEAPVVATSAPTQ